MIGIGRFGKVGGGAEHLGHVAQGRGAFPQTHRRVRQQVSGADAVVDAVAAAAAADTITAADRFVVVAARGLEGTDVVCEGQFEDLGVAPGVCEHGEQSLGVLIRGQQTHLVDGSREGWTVSIHRVCW